MLGNIYDVSNLSEDLVFNFKRVGDDAASLGAVFFDGGIHLRVNKSTGRMEIVNGETVAIDFDGYVIGSLTGDLNSTSWSSLEDQAVTGWEEANSSATLLTELNLISSSVLAAGGKLDLGLAYDGGVSGLEILTFDFRETAFRNLNTVVEYIISGDMDGDGDVDADDVPLFIQALVDRAAYDANGFTNSSGFLVDADAAGDVNDNGIFDFGDITTFSALLGGPASAASVPEPTSAMLCAMVLGLMALNTRNRRIL